MGLRLSSSICLMTPGAIFPGPVVGAKVRVCLSGQTSPTSIRLRRTPQGPDMRMNTHTHSQTHTVSQTHTQSHRHRPPPHHPGQGSKDPYPETLCSTAGPLGGRLSSQPRLPQVLRTPACPAMFMASTTSGKFPVPRCPQLSPPPSLERAGPLVHLGLGLPFPPHHMRFEVVAGVGGVGRHVLCWKARNREGGGWRETEGPG